MGKEAYYFSHDSNARNDEKIIDLRMNLGWEGYGLYWAIIEMLRDEKDYSMQTHYERIAFALHTKSEIIREIIEDYGLFEIDDNSIFFSQSLRNRMALKNAKSSDKSEKARIAANIRWNNNNELCEDDANALQTHSEFMQKERKEKENKKKESKIINWHSEILPFFNDEDFQEVWKDWMKVRKSKKASNSDRAIKAVLNKLNDYSNGNKKIAISIIDKSCQGGWSDVYEPKKEERNPYINYDKNGKPIYNPNAVM